LLFTLARVWVWVAVDVDLSLRAVAAFLEGVLVSLKRGGCVLRFFIGGEKRVEEEGSVLLWGDEAEAEAEAGGGFAIDDDRRVCR